MDAAPANFVAFVEDHKRCGLLRGGHQGVLCQFCSVLCSRCLPRTFGLILLEVTVRGIWLGPRLLESGGTPWARFLFLSATASSCWHVSRWSLGPHCLRSGRRPLTPTHLWANGKARGSTSATPMRGATTP